MTWRVTSARPDPQAAEDAEAHDGEEDDDSGMTMTTWPHDDKTMSTSRIRPAGARSRSQSLSPEAEAPGTEAPGAEAPGMGMLGAREVAVGTAGSCSPRHRMPFNSRHEGTKLV